MRTTRSVSLLAVALLAWLVVDVAAADEWIEVKSAHFTVVSNASERSTRKLVWQLEQVRSATAALWSWAKADLNKPLSVIVLKDQNSMRALAPQYWEDRRSVRPASVWVTAPDTNYLVLRTDVEAEQQGTINPYITAYASYIDLVIGQSLSPDLPLWFRRGFTGVISNTIVRDDHILFGAPIPWKLEILRGRAMLTLPKLLSVTRQSPEDKEADRREVFDAESWAFVHFLMFGDEGARASKLNAYGKLVSTGTDAARAFAESFGPVEALQGPFRAYFQRSIFSFRRINLDVSVERERFPIRPVPPAESASVRALFHAAMRRPVESRAAIAEAMKADPKAPGSYVAEGLLADQDNKVDDAKAAYRKASELGSTSAYAYYRLAQLTWQPNASREVFTEIEQALTKAVELNTRYAAAYAWLGETKAFLGTGESAGLIRRAIVIEPNDARHRLRLAGVLLRQGKPAEARVEAQAALTLADTDEERRDAERLVESATKAAATAAARTAPPSAPPTAVSAPATAAASGTSNSSPSTAGIPLASREDMQALNTSCQSGDNTACGRLLPVVEAECAQKIPSACGFAGFLYERGRGVAADAARAAGFYRQSCDAGDRMGCVGFALLQARGSGVTKDAAKAQATLDELCAGGLLEACTQLAILIVPGGTPADLGRGRELLTKACDGQHPRACELLKSMPKAGK
jgi:TPR repeat protein